MVPTDGSVPAELPPDETGRLDALAAYQILDTLPERVFDDFVFLASHICRTPIALVSLVAKDRQWFKAKVGLDTSETPRTQAFCAHALLTPNEPFVVDDALKDPRFAKNPLVVGAPHIRFYAGVPLVTPDGHAVGTLCAIDSAPRTLDPEQARALEALSRGVVVQLELRRHVAALERMVAAPRGSAASATAAADAAARKTETLLAQADTAHVEDRLRSVLDRLQRLQKGGGVR